jgi:hypoxanthine-DNA glycosylase
MRAPSLYALVILDRRLPTDCAFREQVKPLPEALKSCFPAVAPATTRVLILGSLPGEASLARGQYYAHPRNQFWRLLSEVINGDLTALPYDARLDALKGARIGLWDVISSARRAGSLDGAIRDHTPNALGDLIAALEDLRVVAFNGTKASVVGRHALGAAAGPALISLPSSSPAHTLPFAAKADQWRKLKAFL